MQIAPMRRIVGGPCGRIEIWNLCDVHLGSANCDEELLARVISAIRADRHVYWVGVGDICECVGPHDVRRFDSRCLASWITKDDLRTLITVEHEKAIKYLKPIASKCLGMCIGNHEETATKYYGIATGTHLATTLKVPYLDYYGAVPICLERPGSTSAHQIMLVATHGHGASITPGAILNVLVRACERHADVDILFMGHLHRNLEWVDERVGFTHPKGRGADIIRTRTVRTVAIMSGGFYRGYYPGIPSYAEKKGHRPTALGVNAVEVRIEHVRRDGLEMDEVIVRPIQPRY